MVALSHPACELRELVPTGPGPSQLTLGMDFRWQGDERSDWSATNIKLRPHINVSRQGTYCGTGLLLGANFDVSGRPIDSFLVLPAATDTQGQYEGFRSQ